MSGKTPGLKARSNKTLASRISGSLRGEHKNPAKHETLEILKILHEEDADRYPQAIAKGDEALAYLSAENSPLNERNPFFSALLNTFIPVIRDRVAKIRGNLTSEVAEEHERDFLANYETAKKSYMGLSADQMGKKDIKAIYDLMIDNGVSSRRFYSIESANVKARRQKAKNQAEMAKSAATAAALQARLNALRAKNFGSGTGGTSGKGGTRKLRAKARKTRRAKK